MSEIQIEKNPIQGLGGNTSKLTIDGQIFYAKEFSLESCTEFALWIYIMHAYQSEKTQDKRFFYQCFQFAKANKYMSLTDQPASFFDFLESPQSKRQEFLNLFAQNLQDKQLQAKIDRKAKNLLQTAIDDFYGQQILNLLGLKTPTESHLLQISEGKYLQIQPQVAQQEDNKKINKHYKERAQLKVNQTDQTDVKTLVRNLFCGVFLGDVDLTYTHNNLWSQKKGSNLVKPIIFDAQIDFVKLSELVNNITTISISQFLQLFFKYLIPDSKNLQNKIKNLSEEQLFTYLTKIEYALEKNQSEINKVIENIKKSDSVAGQIVENNIQFLKIFLTIQRQKHPNIPKYDPHLEDKNKHQAYKIPRQLSREDLIDISENLGYKDDVKILNSFVASEVESRNNPQVASEVKSRKKPQVASEVKSRKKPPILRTNSEDSGYASESSNSSDLSKPLKPKILLIKKTDQPVVLPEIKSIVPPTPKPEIIPKNLNITRDNTELILKNPSIQRYLKRQIDNKENINFDDFKATFLTIAHNTGLKISKQDTNNLKIWIKTIYQALKGNQNAIETLKEKNYLSEDFINPQKPKPEQPKPEQEKSNQEKPEQPKPEQLKPEQEKPEQEKTEQAETEQEKTEQPKNANAQEKKINILSKFLKILQKTFTTRHASNPKNTQESKPQIYINQKSLLDGLRGVPTSKHNTQKLQKFKEKI